MNPELPTMNDARRDSEILPTSSDPAATTFHAPAERLTRIELDAQLNIVRRHPLLLKILDSLPDLVVLLNMQRQILAASSGLIQLLGLSDPSEALGLRPGEALGCVHADEGPAGCGTGMHCRNCGAVNTTMGCIKSRRSTQGECAVTLRTSDGEQAFEFGASTVPLELEGARFLIFTVRDISAAKRREVLERVFFHDILNLAGGVQGLADLVAAGDLPNDFEYRRRLQILCRQIVEQIQAQRDLRAAERGELAPVKTRFPVADLLQELEATYESHLIAQGKHLVLLPLANAGLEMESDRSLLLRVLGNLVKNALEASTVGQRIMVRCENPDGKIRFYVHNPGYMPPEVQQRVFQRSFSTKGQKGRGLGTFGSKLITTRYLGGTLGFTSIFSEGTTFTLELPWRAGERAEPAPPDVKQPADLLKGLSILLVDDDPDLARLHRLYLEKAGAVVAVAANGASAVKLAEASMQQGAFPDAVVTDLHLPGMSGIELAHTLRQLRYTNPLLALSATADASERQACLDAGCCTFLRKPIDARTLVAAVRRCLDEARALPSAAHSPALA